MSFAQLYFQSDRNLEQWKWSLSYRISATVRVWQLMYVAYVHMPTFIGILMLLDMRTFMGTIIFTSWFKVFKILLVLIILYCLKNLLPYIWLSIYFVLGRDIFFTFTFVLNKSYFPTFHKNYSIDISPYFIALANLGCQ